MTTLSPRWSVHLRMRIPIQICGLLLLLGCGDYQLFGKDESNRGRDSDTNTPNTGDDETWPKTNGEWCNGEDDDGDGLVDEEFPDTDGDGIADCLDEDCDVRVPEASEVSVEDTCAAHGGVPPEQPWAVKMEWAWRSASHDFEFKNVFTPPVVGSLNDDNFDGRVDEDDIPDVVVVASAGELESPVGVVVAFDGSTGEEHFIYEGIYAIGGVAVADVNGDGRPDILAFDDTYRPILIDGQGKLIWRSETRVYSVAPQVTVADLDADGVVDVIADNVRLNGLDGSVINWYPVSASMEFRMPAVGDVDLDGQQEVIIGNSLFEPDGKRTWTAPVQGAWGHWNAIMDADGDPYGEIAMVADGRLLIIEHNGEVIVDIAAGNDHPGAPCVADFDGDGDPEIGWASNNQFNMHELDGSVIWSRPVNDGTGLLATCSGFDFDGDGQMEVLYGDNETLFFFDGRTGSVLYSHAGHASTTIWEYPTIADVDGDGAAEVLVASNAIFSDGWTGVTVLGHLHDQWMVGGPNWHVHDFMVTNVNDDGTVPVRPIPPWQVYNMYRARPAERMLWVDLQMFVIDACFTGCKAGGLAKFAVQAVNTGSNNTQTGIEIAMYARSGDQLELLDVQLFQNRIAAGRTSETLVFEVPVTSLGTDGVVFRVDDDGGGNERHEECDETNNEAEWRDIPCE